MRLLVARRRDQVKLLPTIFIEAFRRGLRSLAMGVVLLSCSLRPAPIERAAMLAERGRTDDAIEVLEEHLAGEPAALEERKLLIRLQGSVGRLDAARDQTERLVEMLPPRSPLPWVELGHAYELAHRYEEALAAYDEAASVAPSDALGPKRGGLRAARWGELAWAAPRLAEAARRAPGDAEVWHALGWVRVGLGELDAARQAYTAGLSADPGAIENHLGLATVALRLHEPRSALEQYEALLRARPSSTDALLGKSWSLILLGELRHAAAVLMEAEARGADARTIARQRLAMEERKRKRP